MSGPVVKSIFEENGTFSAKCQLYWEDADLNFDKMALWFDESSDMKSFKEQWENTFDFILRDPTFYEVVPKGYSKATGIDFLCKRLEIDRAHTVGIGDSTNDLTMLDFTGISISRTCCIGASEWMQWEAAIRIFFRRSIM